MKSSNDIIDYQGQTWILGPELGRGRWGKSRLVRTAAGQEAVFKEPLTASDFPGSAAVPEAWIRACNVAAREQAALLNRANDPLLPRLLGIVDLGAGRVGLLLPKFSSSLEQRLQAGLGLSEGLRIIQDLARQLAARGTPHGALHPRNILFSEGSTVVLSDPFTAGLQQLRPTLERAANLHRWLPPEARGNATSGWDAWALNAVLFVMAMSEKSSADVPRTGKVLPPHVGIDKIALATLKDRAFNRLSTERTNPRFRTRLAQGLSRMLNRGLSKECEPSPPFRFTDLPTFLHRLEEVAALVRPGVEEVGRLMLSTREPVFCGDELVQFVITVGCTFDVKPEDVVAGIALIDLDGDGRIPCPDAKFTVKTLPTGRLRYQFELPDVAPSRYKVKVAFSVRDSGHAAKTVDGRFEVRPPPGYVPPPSEPPEPVLAFSAENDPNVFAPPEPSYPGDLEEDVAHLSADNLPSEWTEETSPSEPMGELIEGLFPKPIAPPSAVNTSLPVAPAPPPLKPSPAPLAAPVSMVPQTQTARTQQASPYQAVACSSPTAATIAPEPTPMVVNGNSVAVAPPPPVAKVSPTIAAPWVNATNPGIEHTQAEGDDEHQSAVYSSFFAPIEQEADPFTLPTEMTAEVPNRASSFVRDLVEQVVVLIRNDRYATVVAAFAACLMVVLLLTVLLKAF